MYRYLVIAVLVVSVIGGAGGIGYHRGYQSADEACRLEQAEHIKRAIEQERDIAKRDAEVSRGYEARKSRRMVATKTIEKEIVREIPVDCTQCRISDDALGMLNRALAGDFMQTPAAPGEPNSPGATSDANPGRQFPGNGFEGTGVERKTI